MIQKRKLFLIFALSKYNHKLSITTIVYFNIHLVLVHREYQNIQTITLSYFILMADQIIKSHKQSLNVLQRQRTVSFKMKQNFVMVWEGQGHLDMASEYSCSVIMSDHRVVSQCHLLS